MKIWNIFKGLNKKKSSFHRYGILHLWEDNYLMIELLPIENLEFLKSETKRIKEFSQEHFDGVSFTGITGIGEKPIKTIDKKIPLDRVTEIIEKSGLKKIREVVMEGVGFLSDYNVPLGFGSSRFAILLEHEDKIVKHIWITGEPQHDNEIAKIISGLFQIGQEYDMVGVNWFQDEYYVLKELKQVNEFVENIC